MRLESRTGTRLSWSVLQQLRRDSGTVREMSYLVHGVASYEVILDRPLSLAVGEDIDQSYDFELPSDVMTDRPAVLSILLHSVDETAHLTVEINKTTVYHGHPGSSAPRSFHEVVGPVVTSGDNEINFTVATGGIVFSDVVLWYARDARAVDQTVTGEGIGDWGIWPWNW